MLCSPSPPLECCAQGHRHWSASLWLRVESGHHLVKRGGPQQDDGPTSTTVALTISQSIINTHFCNLTASLQRAKAFTKLNLHNTYHFIGSSMATSGRPTLRPFRSLRVQDYALWSNKWIIINVAKLLTRLISTLFPFLERRSLGSLQLYDGPVHYCTFPLPPRSDSSVCGKGGRFRYRDGRCPIPAEHQGRKAPPMCLLQSRHFFFREELWHG